MEDSEQLKKALQNLMASDLVSRGDAESLMLRDPEASGPILMQALDKSQKQLGKIALLLGALTLRDALPRLIALSLDKSIEELDRAQIVRAISEIADGQDAFDERAMQAFRGLESDESQLVRGMLTKVYQAIGDVTSLERLTLLLRDSDVFVREKAQKALDYLAEAEDVGKYNVGELIDALRSPNPALVRRALQSLKQIASPLAVMPLLSLIDGFGEDDSTLRADALRALANSLSGAEQGLLEALLPLTKAKDQETRAAVLLCLGRIADSKGRSLQAIILGLMSRDKMVIEAAAVALSEGFRAEHAHLLRFLVDIYGRRNLPDASREAILIAFSRVPITDDVLRASLRRQIVADLKSKVVNIRKTAIVVLEALHDDTHPVPASLAQTVAELLLDPSVEIQIVSASFLAKHMPRGLRLTKEWVRPSLMGQASPVSYLLIDALRRAGTEEARVLIDETRRIGDHSLEAYATKVLDEWKAVG